MLHKIRMPSTLVCYSFIICMIVCVSLSNASISASKSTRLLTAIGTVGVDSLADVTTEKKKEDMNSWINVLEWVGQAELEMWWEICYLELSKWSFNCPFKIPVKTGHCFPMPCVKSSLIYYLYRSVDCWRSSGWRGHHRQSAATEAPDVRY